MDFVISSNTIYPSFNYKTQLEIVYKRPEYMYLCDIDILCSENKLKSYFWKSLGIYKYNKNYENSLIKFIKEKFGLSVLDYLANKSTSHYSEMLCNNIKKKVFLKPKYFKFIDDYICNEYMCSKLKGVLSYQEIESGHLLITLNNISILGDILKFLSDILHLELIHKIEILRVNDKIGFNMMRLICPEIYTEKTYLKQMRLDDFKFLKLNEQKMCGFFKRLIKMGYAMNKFRF